MAKRNFIEELRARANEDGLYGQLADYMNERLIKTNQTIFEYVPIDGLKEGKQYLQPVIQKLRDKGFWEDGN